MTKPCPVCGEAVEQRTGGRPAVYCSPVHRREVERLRRVLPELERQAADAQRLAKETARYKLSQTYARRHQAERYAAELEDARAIVAAADERTG